MPLIFSLTGVALWTDSEPVETKHGWQFDALRTLVLAPAPDGVKLIKLTEDIGKPDVVTFTANAIQSIRESRDEDLNLKARAALSGLTLAR